MKEIKRVKFEDEEFGAEFRLVDKPGVIKYPGGSHRYRYMIQARLPGQFRFQDFFIQHGKKEALEKRLADQKELERIAITFHAAQQAIGAVNRIVGKELRR